MQIKEILEIVRANYPQIPEYGKSLADCDGIKFGDPLQECTGIACAIAPTIDVIRKAADNNCNLLYIHEPSFYTHFDVTDWLVEDEVYRKKTQLLTEYHMTIYRDHDHIHSNQPDGIFTGIAEELGWEKYCLNSSDERMMDYCIPEIDVKDLVKILKEKIGLNGLRVIGNPNAKIKKISFVTHLLGGSMEDQQEVIKKVQREKIDAIIPLECIDWTATSYMNDAGKLGLNKVMIQMGHMNTEALGCKWMVRNLNKLLSDSVPVHFIQTDDMFQYF